MLGVSIVSDVVYDRGSKHECMIQTPTLGEGDSSMTDGRTVGF
jgi:hypothetical protein